MDLSVKHAIGSGAAAAELPIVLLIAPALLFPSPALVALALAVPAVWGLCRLSGRDLIPATPLNVSLLVLLVMVGVSLAVTFDAGESLNKVAGVLLGVYMFWATARWVSTRARFVAARSAFVLAGALLAVVGLLGTNWFLKFSTFRGILSLLPPVIRGIPGAREGFHPNAVAGSLVLFVPLQIALLAARAPLGLHPTRTSANVMHVSLSMAVQVVTLALTAGTLILTQSRGAWVAMAAAAACFFAWHGGKTRIMVAVGAVVLIGALFALDPQAVANLAVSQSGEGLTGSIDGRIELWSSALRAIRDFPFTGMGMNAFRHVMPVMYPSKFIPPDVDVAHAHNHLLEAALDVGIPGLIAYLSIWVITAILLVQVRRQAPDAIDRRTAGGLGVGLMAHFLFGVTDAIPLGAKVGVLFWMALGLVVALHRTAVVGFRERAAERMGYDHLGQPGGQVLQFDEAQTPPSRSTFMPPFLFNIKRQNGPSALHATAPSQDKHRRLS